jgi:CyaY protein
MSEHAQDPVQTTSVGAATSLTDAEYQRHAGGLLAHIESTVDSWLDNDIIDIDSQRSGGLLELHFPGGSKIIINLQPPLHEVWLAAKGGGFHYRWQAGQWLDTRDGSEFLAVLSAHASAQAGQALSFARPADTAAASA